MSLVKFLLPFLSDLSGASLRFLNSEQALADLAAFRQAMTDKYNLTTNRWISFGGSYPGSLSAWFRLKYPHLVDGKVNIQLAKEQKKWERVF